VAGTISVASDSPPVLLRLDRVSCHYGSHPVVQEASLSLVAGELGCLLGPSGCGKTTLLRAVAGFHPVAGGQVLLRGTDATAQSPERRGIGFVFQDLALFPHLTVAGNVGFGLHRLPRSARAARISEALEPLGLTPFADRYPHELSGGQQQRVALARSLAPRPDLLLLDEPFSSLDAHLRLSLRGELRDLLKHWGIAALLVTHDQDEAFAFADTVGVMREGRLLQWAAGFDVYHRPVDPFVAGFVGEGRFLRGRVIDAHKVDTTLGVLRTHRVIEFLPGSEVRVLMRPDDVRPSENGGIETEVVSAVFRGAETFYALRLADGETVCALFPSHLQLDPGERIRIRTDLEHVVIFGPDAGQP
jgi:iron(III) transport system ATP-binding protein